MEEQPQQNHVLLLPYPSQGHINPMLQFARRLASYGPMTTLVTTRYIVSSTNPEPGVVRIASFSDGFDQGGFFECGSVSDYLYRLEMVGSITLQELIRSEADAGRPIHVLVFDAFLPWAGDVGRRMGLRTIAFFTQACAVDLVYCHVWKKRLNLPVREPVELPGLVRLGPKDMPSFLPDEMHYPAYLQMVLHQFKDLEKVDEVLINSFYELEIEETDYFSANYKAKTIGPTVPSKYVDNRIPTDAHYGFNLFALTDFPCMQWLDSKPSASVLYVSFGSMVTFSSEQIYELAFGLADSGTTFLWVVRTSEADKLPENFIELHCKDRGMIVSWSPQIEVLSHKAIGCFLTHCGWNSTLEGICVGVPMIGMPQWTDQPTDAKYIEDVWKVGIRVREEEGGLVKREEVVRCVKEVMEGERSEEMRRNAMKWRELACKAMEEGGSSDKNIVEFVAKYCTSSK